MNDLNRAISRLEDALGQLGAEHVPPIGWEDRVLGALDSAQSEPRLEPAEILPEAIVLPWRPANGRAPRGDRIRPGAVLERTVAAEALDARPRPRLPWRSIAAVEAFSLVAATVCIVLGLKPPAAPAAPPQLELDLAWASAAPVMRGGAGAPEVGDIIRATALGGPAHHAVWVYRDDQLVVACPGAPDCQGSSAVAIVDLVLRVHGVYVFLALASTGPLPAPRGFYDVDAANAAVAGVITRSHSLRVR